MIKQGENSIGAGKLYGRNTSTDTWAEITDFSNIDIIFSLQNSNKKEIAVLKYHVDASSNITILLPSIVTSVISGQFYLEVILKDKTSGEIIIANNLGKIIISQSTGGKTYGVSI